MVEQKHHGMKQKQTFRSQWRVVGQEVLPEVLPGRQTYYNWTQTSKLF